MTLGDLLQYLDDNTAFGILDGSAAETIDKARNGTHARPLVGEVINAIVEKTGAADATSECERAAVVNALGPLRLKYMADDAPVEGFQLVEGVIPTIDAAFNEEALRQQGKL